MTKLAAIEHLYALWASGELASEDTLFELGDILGPEVSAIVEPLRRTSSAKDAIGSAL